MAGRPNELWIRQDCEEVIGYLGHSDDGSHSQARSFVHILNEHHLIRSMRHPGVPPGETQPWGSPFSLLQSSVLNRYRWQIREQLRVAIITGIEKTCYRRYRRISRGSHGLIPECHPPKQ